MGDEAHGEEFRAACVELDKLYGRDRQPESSFGLPMEENLFGMPMENIASESIDQAYEATQALMNTESIGVKLTKSVLGVAAVLFICTVLAVSSFLTYVNEEILTETNKNQMGKIVQESFDSAYNILSSFSGQKKGRNPFDNAKEKFLRFQTYLETYPLRM